MNDARPTLVPPDPGADTRIPPPSPRISPRAWILGWALLQAASLWALVHWARGNGAGFVTLLPLFSVVQTLPLTMELLARHRGRLLLWLLAVALALLLAAACLGVSRDVGIEGHGLSSNIHVMVWLLVLQPICWFALLPFIEQRLTTGRRANDYARLFDRAGQFACSLGVAGVFLGLCWLILQLLAGLFKMLGIALFENLFGDAPFAWAITALSGGIGLMLCATWEEKLSGYWRAMLSVLGWLLPLAGTVALLFVLALLVRGLAPLWETGHASALMMILMGALALLFNMAWNDGAPERQRFGTWLRRYVNLTLLTLPVCAALTGWALYLRVAQYGWSAGRVWAALAAALLAMCAVGYAVAAVMSFFPRQSWMALARPVNISVVGLAVVLALLTCTPVLNPDRIMVASQVSRLLSQRVAADAFNYADLRYGGRAGRDALERLSREQAHPQAADIRRRATAALTDSSIEDFLSADEVRARLIPYPANVPLAQCRLAGDRFAGNERQKRQRPVVDQERLPARIAVPRAAHRPRWRWAD